MEPPFSLYIHIPFCRHRCAYCDFNTYAGLGRLMPDYVQALCAEISAVGQASPARLAVHTIFFGGGTPSLLSAAAVEAILAAALAYFDILPGAEITLEANPGTVSLESLRDLHRLGINRLSLGVQSFHPDDLRLLERQHDSFDVFHAVKWARLAGFENLNLDLIYGLPGQTLARWQSTLEQAVRLKPQHLSLYALGIAPGTPFHQWRLRGLLPEPEEDLAADMYDSATESLDAAGYRQYEISNWARGSGHSCQHNLQYWRALPYLGFGAGAHGYACGIRTANVSGIVEYINRIHQKPAGPAQGFPAGAAASVVNRLERWTEIEEAVMVGLRLVEEGVSLAGFRARFGLELQEAFPRQIRDLLALGLVEETTGDQACLRLARRARLVGNQVFMRFVGNPAPGELQSR